jgi:very-short-patch-repair endonuclease
MQAMFNPRGRETAAKGWWRKLQPESQRMRTNPTRAEDVLWQAIRSHRLGARFRRQHAIDRFIVDFVCLLAKLVVEVDGDVHSQVERRDAERDSILQAAGFLVLRYPNRKVLRELATVVDEIRNHLAARLKAPLPLERGSLTTKSATK